MVKAPEALDRLAFSAGEEDYRWADIVAAARAWGRWDEIARLAAREAPKVGEAELAAAGEAFRYERGLLAADEMEAWLRHWGLTQAAWSSYLRRTLSSAAPAQSGEAPSGEAEEEDIWAEAVCSGALFELARELAARAAAAEARGTGAGAIEPDLGRMGEELTAFVEDALTPEARAKALELRSADWVRLTFTELELPEQGMANEAALCVREDGLSLAEVAERAGVALREREAFIEEVDGELSKALLSAPPGELVGPVRVADGFALLRVHEKVAPVLGDPVIQARVEEEVPRRALEREVRNRVRWHERL
jgi:hypothetical protein